MPLCKRCCNRLPFHANGTPTRTRRWHRTLQPIYRPAHIERLRSGCQCRRLRSDHRRNRTSCRRTRSCCRWDDRDDEEYRQLYPALPGPAETAAILQFPVRGRKDGDTVQGAVGAADTGSFLHTSSAGHGQGKQEDTARHTESCR